MTKVPVISEMLKTLTDTPLCLRQVGPPQHAGG